MKYGARIGMVLVGALGLALSGCARDVSGPPAGPRVPIADRGGSPHGGGGGGGGGGSATGSISTATFRADASSSPDRMFSDGSGAYEDGADNVTVGFTKDGRIHFSTSSSVTRTMCVDLTDGPTLEPEPSVSDPDLQKALDDAWGLAGQLLTSSDSCLPLSLFTRDQSPSDASALQPGQTATAGGRFMGNTEKLGGGEQITFKLRFDGGTGAQQPCSWCLETTDVGHGFLITRTQAGSWTLEPSPDDVATLAAVVSVKGKGGQYGIALVHVPFLITFAP